MRTAILGTFFLASEDEIQEGMNWYKNARMVCRRIADSHCISLDTVAAVVAALSPQNPWDRNIRDAESIIKLYTAGGPDAAREYKCGTFNRNKEKAIRILSSEKDRLELMEILNGQKIKDFFICIADSLGEYDRCNYAVCVDGHAYSIWLGERVSTAETPKITPKLYNQIRLDYIDATDKINTILKTNYIPAQIQSITWVVHRNLYKGQRKPRKTK